LRIAPALHLHHGANPRRRNAESPRGLDDSGRDGIRCELRPGDAHRPGMDRGSSQQGDGERDADRKT
jgi:hypothetical protein